MSVRDEAYEKLLRDLEKARKKHSPRSLAGTDIAVAAAHDYLKAIGVPSELLNPLAYTAVILLESHIANQQKGKPGPRTGRRLLREMAALTEAAAIVTTLKEKKWASIPEALSRVSSATGINREELRKFRDSIHRGTTDVLTNTLYDGYVADLAGASREEINESLRGTRAVYRVFVKSTG